MRTRRNAANAARALADYINAGIDPFDFSHLLVDFAEDGHEEVFDFEHDDEVYVENLPEALVADFKEWLRGQPITQGMPEDPAYLHFHDAKVLSPGGWYVHFTNEYFNGFDRGTTLDSGLALSTWRKQKTRVRCDVNLTDDSSLHETVFGFAVRLQELTRAHHVRHYQEKYGKNLFLFRTDEAVLMYHVGDEEHQVLFPICSEYDAVMMHVDEYDSEKLTVTTKGYNDIEFEDFDDVIRWIEQGRPEPEEEESE